jgi:DNA-binding GntR family transcriptional regulator
MGPVSAVSLVDQVTVAVRRSIIHGDLTPGERFSISEIATRLGVSHIPVREALRRLESEGLVDLKPVKGAEVRPMNEADLAGIYGLRLAIEPALAARGAVMLTDAEITELVSMLDIYDSGADIDEEFAMHQAFHLRIMRPAASEWDLRILDHLSAANERYARLRFDIDDTDLQSELRRSHSALVDAVGSRSAVWVQAATVEHLKQNEQAILEVMRARDRDAERSQAVSATLG